MMKCLKCQKQYIPKRIGGLFCGDSCGNSYRQKKKRDEQKKAKLVEQGLAVERPLTIEEIVLWDILSMLAGEANQIQVDEALPADKKPADLGMRKMRLVSYCKSSAELLEMKSLGIRYQAQKEAKKRADEAQQKKDKGK